MLNIYHKHKGEHVKNKLLFITRQTIPYIKELRPLAGSVTACILWQQLDFYFVKYPNGFYKFLEPCNHKDYKRTDSGRHFKHAQTHFKHINARLQEGFTIDEQRLIVDIKTAQWRDDPKMSQYLRPATLFGPKADGYLQAALQTNPLVAGGNGNQVGIIKEGKPYNEGNSKDYQPRKSKADEFKDTLDRLYPSTAKPGRIIDVDG